METSQSHASPLANTAAWTAAVRAMETRRPDKLFDDPYAEALAGEVGAAWIAGCTAESVAPITLRTRFFDDFLTHITQEDGIRQVVLVGAGLDTRAYRLHWPDGTHLFEIDQPQVLERKERLLLEAGARPACTLLTAAVDVTGLWQEALLEAGYQPGQSSGWLVEGLLFYLPSEAILNLLQGVMEMAAPESWIGFDVVNSEMYSSPLSAQWLEMQRTCGAPWIGSLDDPAAFLAQHGWQATLTQAGQPDANYGRWPFPVYPTDMTRMPHNWFVTARKR
ncbi:MAG: SAM-dependent methyltransferase [Anaerolineales bacterium]